MCHYLVTPDPYWLLDSIALSTHRVDYLSLSKEHKSQGLGAGLLDKETSDSDPGKVISTLLKRKAAYRRCQQTVQLNNFDMKIYYFTTLICIWLMASFLLSASWLLMVLRVLMLFAIPLPRLLCTISDVDETKQRYLMNNKSGYLCVCVALR